MPFCGMARRCKEVGMQDKASHQHFQLFFFQGISDVLFDGEDKD
jgi:hypothetical protein